MMFVVPLATAVAVFVVARPAGIEATPVLVLVHVKVLPAMGLAFESSATAVNC
jgi:hypothetical protein